jgi:hypothetical protein
MRGFPLQEREAAEAARDAIEDEDRDRLALESAWDKIDNKIHAATPGAGREYVVKFTLLELKMLRQFRRKHA